MKKSLLLLCSLFLFSFTLLVFPSSIYAATYYVSPTGNDTTTPTNNSLQSPWKTFARAFQTLTAGDTLILLDGIYTETLIPTKAGTSTSWITIKAANDGKAILDGQFRRQTIILDWRTPQDTYIAIEGITARNGVDRTIIISTNYVTLRRIHAYSDFHPWESAQVTDLTHPLWTGINHDILIEDCIMSGAASKLLKTFRTTRTTVRRCLLDWRWNGAHTDHNAWPWSGGLNVYHTGDSIFENIISVGAAAHYGINMHGNEDMANSDPTSNNKYLGSIAMDTAMQRNGTSVNFGTVRAMPNSVYTNPTQAIHNPDWTGWGAGFNFGGRVENVLLQDIVAYGNADVGFFAGGIIGDTSQNRIRNATFINNGLDDRYTRLPVGSEYEIQSGAFSLDSTSFIEGNSTYQGPGADITKRYVDGVKSSQALWPWSMEQRIRDELGYSITNRIAAILPGQVNQIPDIPRPVMAADSTFIAFRNITTSETETKSVVFTNPGDGALTIASLTVVNEIAPVFSVGNGSNACPQSGTLAAGQSCNLYVTFAPVANGTIYSGRLLVYPGNMGTTNFPFIVNLAGNDSTAPLPTNTPVPNSPTNTPTLTQSPTPTPLPGDVNGDGNVNLVDLAALLSNFGKQTSNGDVNGDGNVNLTDLSTLLANFGK